MNRTVVFAAAKLNLTLDIVGRRADGYHLMEMVMQTIDLGDIICLEKSELISFESSGIKVPPGDQNIAVRAAVAFFEHTKIEGGVAINLYKKIPTMAGMGGGSADGAAVLRGLNSLYNCGMSLAKLASIGERVGADIPFCVYGGTALVSGIGEVVVPISPIGECHFVVAKPQASVDTKKAFADFDAIKTTYARGSQNMVDALNGGDLALVNAELFNAFEQVVSDAEIDEIKAAMRLCGAENPIMTGSGSAVFCIFREHECALNCYEALKKSNPNAQVFLCKPV